MEPLSAVIVDDEKEARELLSNIINDHVPQVNVIAQAASADEAIGLILERKPEIVFLDIDMPVKNGFDVARSISRHNIQTSIVFVTAFNQFAIEAIKHSAFDYLLKPVGIGDLKACIERYRTTRETESLQQSVSKLLQCLHTEKIAFPGRNTTLYIDTQSIVYCEAEGNYTEIHLQEGISHTISRNLGSIESQLSGNGFGRINRSTLINKKYLHKIDHREKKCFLLANGQSYALDIKGSYMKRWEG